MRLNAFFFILVLPYLAVRRMFRLCFGNIENYRIFHQAGLDSTWDYLSKLGIPVVARSWIDVRTRFAFEKKIANALTRVRGRWFLDIGANMGYYSALVAKNFETVLAFEPAPENLRLLRDMVRVGKLRNVRISDMAISDSDGVEKLYFYPQRVAHSLEHAGRDDRGIRVRTAKLDSVITNRVDLVKVDVEGAEWRVLKGAEESIWQGRIRAMVIEIHDLDRRKEMEDYLRERQFLTQWLDANHILARFRESDAQPI